MSKQTAGCNSARLFFYVKCENVKQKNQITNHARFPQTSYSTFPQVRFTRILHNLTEFPGFLSVSIFSVDNLHRLCYYVKKVLTVRYDFSNE